MDKKQYNIKQNENATTLFVVGLQLLFIGMKLGGKIAWSWWWVLSPFWIPIAFGLLLVFLLWVFGVKKI